MANVHSHAFQRGMAGFTEFRGPDADNFWSWRTLMYRFVGRMTPEDLEAISAQAFMEMLEAGFTRVGEFHYVHHDTAGNAYANPAEMTERVAAAASEAGIALTLLPVFYAHSGFGGAHPNEGQRRFLLDVPRFSRLLEDALKVRREVARCAPRSRAAQPARGDAGGAGAGHGARARRADPHSRGGANRRSGAVPRLVGRAAGAMAARQRAGRCALVPGACHAHDG